MGESVLYIKKYCEIVLMQLYKGNKLQIFAIIVNKGRKCNVAVKRLKPLTL